jgi:hypothetical protein
MATQITALDTALLRVPTGTRWAAFGVTELEVVHVTLTDGEGATGTGFTFSVSGGAAAMRTLLRPSTRKATVTPLRKGPDPAADACTGGSHEPAPAIEELGEITERF